MEKTKKLKIILGLFYLICVSSFLFFFFSKFTFEEVTSYRFIQDNREYFFELKRNNLLMLSIIFLILTIAWVFAAGFGSPVGLVAGFIFGKWLGIFLVVLGASIGATILYIFGNYFFKEIIKKKFLDKFIALESKFKKSEFNYLLLYRFIGGIPFALSNVLPCIFNVSVKNFFWATFLGITPQLFLIVSLGSGIEKIIGKNESAPHIKDLIFLPEIYIPLLGFIFLVIFTLITKKIFYKK
ncbi:VTT domain-containing protein [Candidatus Pelagibacter sp.]|nr:VTT domain-containing protein [Candidatus Pelagibacter sp.]